MKRYFFAVFTIFLFGFMLIFPELVFVGARNGLMLWFHTVLPTLLPFLIIVNIMQKTNLIRQISRIMAPFTTPLFHISRTGSFAVLTGFLCGYPMGAKVTADLVRDRKITKQEGAYLLSFCNHTSPGFMAGFVVTQTLQDTTLLVPTLLIFFLVPVLLSFLFRKLHMRQELFRKTVPPEAKPGYSESNVFDLAIMNGFETITKIGGYMIAFSVLIEILRSVSLFHSKMGVIILSFLEITNGVGTLDALPYPFGIRYALIMGLCAFGGLCAAAQTNGMLSESGLKLFPYIIEKLIAALATSFLSYCYIQLCGY